MTEKIDDLTEKVARTICCSSGACWADHNGGACDWPHKHFAAKAAIRAVLDGIREPDDAMKGEMMRFREVMTAQHHPDVYAGPNCNQLSPEWIGSAEGGMDGDSPIGDSITLAAKTFPPGTKVSVSTPECPECGESSDSYWDHKTETFETCNCGFDWAAWCRDEFS